MEGKKETRSVKPCCLSDLQKDGAVHQIYETMQIISLQQNVRFFLNFVSMFFSRALQHKAVCSIASSTVQLKVCMRKG